MSVDDRLRSALGDQAETLSPEVERGLADVRRRGRRARPRPAVLVPAAAAAAAAAVVGTVTWVSPPGTGDLPGPGRSGSPTVLTEPEMPSLRGSLFAEVDEPAALRGRWELRLEGNGTLVVTPPPAYPRVVSDALFSSDESTFRTTLLGLGACRGEGTGIYEWAETSARVEFSVISDRCPERIDLLQGAVWTASTDGVPRS